jgi:hypothetical protein
MVVSDDDVDARVLGGSQRVVVVRAAVVSDNQFRALFDCESQTLRGEAVALGLAVRQVVDDVGTEPAKHRNQKDRAGHAVYIIVAVDEDAFTPFDSGEDALGRGDDVGQQVGFAQPGRRGVEERADVVGGGVPAAEQQVHGEFRQVELAAEQHGVAGRRRRKPPAVSRLNRRHY